VVYTVHRAASQAEEARAEAGEPALLAFVAGHGHGVPEQRPENSVYYHPTLNPSGTPPPGKPQRYRTALALPAPPPAAGIPVPKPPPLPKGPAPARPMLVSDSLCPASDARSFGLNHSTVLILKQISGSFRRVLRFVCTQPEPRCYLVDVVFSGLVGHHAKGSPKRI